MATKRASQQFTGGGQRAPALLPSGSSVWLISIPELVHWTWNGGHNGRANRGYTRLVLFTGLRLRLLTDRQSAERSMLASPLLQEIGRPIHRATICGAITPP